MLVSYLWLKELVDFDLEPDKLAETLTSLGLECAVIDNRLGWYENIVVGKALEVTKHPNADRLRLCKVDTGEDVLDIVCGASNIAAGQLVPVALVGAKLPDGMKIKKSKIRGVESHGMIASESELKLSEDHDGIMVLTDDPKPGEKFSERYEVCDAILEVDLTPNRGDCSSMIGIAREVAAATGSKLKKPATDIETDSNENIADLVKVVIDAPDLCPRYAAMAIKNAKIGPSPFWLRRRLAAVGVRAINNIVDITNYTLMETGHPLHAFDLANIEGNSIVVRRASDNEEFTTLDSKTYKLTSENLVIADESKAVALAGIMGGQNSEVTERTSDILLEAAYFDPKSIRRSSKMLNISSESSYRFERGTDVEGLIYAQKRAAKLMTELAGGRLLEGRVDAYPEKIEKRSVALRFSRTDKILGITTPPQKVKEILANLEMEILSSADDSVTVGAPYFRNDIEREIDLIEEIARFVGYDKFPSLTPETAVNESGPGRCFTFRRAVRNHLRSVGMMEAISLSFTGMEDMDKLRLPEDHPYRNLVATDNPLSSEWTHLRSTLLPGLLSSMKGEDAAQFFETGVVFRSAGNDAPVESWNLTGIITETSKTDVWKGRAAKHDFYHIKGVVESTLDILGFGGGYSFRLSSHPFYYPKRQADIYIGSEIVGHLGQIHPTVIEAYETGQEIFMFEMDLDHITDIPALAKSYSGMPKFPSVRRDLAVVVKESVTALEMTGSIMKNGNKGNIICDATLFDIYRGKNIEDNAKSMAFALEFRDSEKTLTDDEVDELFNFIISGLKNDCGAELR